MNTVIPFHLKERARRPESARVDMSISRDIRDLVDDLELCLRANDALEFLIGAMSSAFFKCSLVATRGLFDEMAVLDAVNAISVCISASGGDSRVTGLCRYALKLGGVSEDEIRIDSDGNVVRRQVYFVKNGRGLIKIGSSLNVNDRIGGLETGAGERLELLLSVPGSAEVERRLHRKFSRLNEHGEWFRPESELTSYIESLRASRA